MSPLLSFTKSSTDDANTTQHGPVRAVIATPDLSLMNALQTAANLMTDKISLASLVPTASLLDATLKNIQPEVILLDAEFARELDNPDDFLNILTRLGQTIAIVVFPAVANAAELQNHLAQYPTMRGSFPKPVDPNALLAEAARQALAERQRVAETSPLVAANQPGFQRRATSRGGQLNICVIAFKKGGVGKTTIATNLWHWFNVNVGPSLLVGFDTPDDCVAQLNMPPQPNMLNYFHTPTFEGLRASTQKFQGQYDVVFSPGDDRAAQQEILTAQKNGQVVGSAILRELLVEAATSSVGYHAVIMDVPPSYDAYAVRPMAFANRLLLVMEPDVQCLTKAVDGIDKFTERANEPIDRTKVAVVLNRWAPVTKLQIKDIEEGFRQGLNGWCPPIIAKIPYDEMVREYQVDGIIPATKPGPFADAINALGEYFTGQSARPANSKRSPFGLRLPQIKVG